jgi:hypothetical protein
MKIIRTADLTKLQVWLLGGYTDNLGGFCEGFNTFCDDEYADELNSVSDVKSAIIDLINEYGNEPSTRPCRSFEYHGDYYKFKMPSTKNLDILAKRVWAWVQEQRREVE